MNQNPEEIENENSEHLITMQNAQIARLTDEVANLNRLITIRDYVILAMGVFIPVFLMLTE